MPMRLVGRRSDDMLVLSGGPFAIFVDPQGCTLISSTGEKLGRLDRVQRTSPTMWSAPPEGSIVLFDGTNTQHLENAVVGENGLLSEGFTIKPMIQDFDLHVEFRLPYMPGFDDQKRGNSGIYIHSRYECQVLDSFAQEPKFNHLGSLYRFKAPDVNMAFPPLSWQTYDIRFTSPRYNADGSKFSDARVTSWVNGVKVQDDVSLSSPTGNGKDEEPLQLPIHFQNHNDPIRFRNLWMVDRGLVQADFPVEGTGEPAATEDSIGEKEIAEYDAEYDAEMKKQELAENESPDSAEPSKAEAAKDELPRSTPIISEESQESPAPIVK